MPLSKLHLDAELDCHFRLGLDPEEHRERIGEVLDQGWFQVRDDNQSFLLALPPLAVPNLMPQGFVRACYQAVTRRSKEPRSIHRAAGLAGKQRMAGESPALRLQQGWAPDRRST